MCTLLWYVQGHCAFLHLSCGFNTCVWAERGVSAPGQGTSCLVKPPPLLNGAHPCLPRCPSPIRWNQANSQAVETRSR